MPRRAADGALLVPCPGCQKQTAYSSENQWRPFCSERCRGADLGAWAAEKFRLAADPPDDIATQHPSDFSADDPAGH